MHLVSLQTNSVTREDLLMHLTRLKEAYRFIVNKNNFINHSTSMYMEDNIIKPFYMIKCIKYMKECELHLKEDLRFTSTLHRILASKSKNSVIKRKRLVCCSFSEAELLDGFLLKIFVRHWIF